MSFVLPSQISNDLSVLEIGLRELLYSNVEFIQLIADDLISAGGKRFRPALVFLGARALGLDADSHLVNVAMAVELLHSATLLHDDLVDNAQLRRGKEAAFRRYGNAVSVLSGDFLLSRVLKLLSQLPSSLTEEFAQTSMRICEGEVLQFQMAAYGTYQISDYLEVITAKTAVLVATALRAPALLTSQPIHVLDALTQYGLSYGRAFQMRDDFLDLMATCEDWGKPIGSDLKEGKVTLPVLYLLQGPFEKATLEILKRRASEPGDVDSIRTWLIETGGVEHIRSEIHKEVTLAVLALDALPETPERNTLEQLARYETSRMS
ncbi:MAG: polyprenyl synthetase family protein [Deinococcaceae bacterium]